MSKKTKATEPSTSDSDPSPSTDANRQTDVIQPDQSASSSPHANQLSRYVSFGLLLAVIGLVGFFFYEVMISFLVPLFLASILVVVFRPLHRWVLEKCGGRTRLGALLTTLAILLSVLVPISALFLMAIMEGQDVVRQFNSAKLENGVRTIRTNLRLDLPAARQFREVESGLAELQQSGVLDAKEIDRQQASLYEIQESAKILGKEIHRVWPDKSEWQTENTEVTGADQSKTDADSTDPDLADDDADPAINPNDHWKMFAIGLEQARELNSNPLLIRRPDESPEKSRQQLEANREYRNKIEATASEFSQFKSKLLGGKTKAWLAELVNPTEDELEKYTANSVTFLRDKLFKIGGGAASFLGGTALGFAIMVIGLYFFLLDGPRMIETFQGLSPIDDEHEQELVAEFAKVSRAVVVATLLSAMVQGVLAGIGFYFAGLESIFLLTVLSAVLAMVPFVGAAAVWVPCCFYLYFFDDNLGAAIGLAIFGTLVISMADNVIKPYVLHGQSNLHPLLALLSVLGGVATLGPIGILVGPMIVAFLQTLLKILQREIAAIENSGDDGTNEQPPNTRLN
jgi:predicted PurR-regulated permease PerM